VKFEPVDQRIQFSLFTSLLIENEIEKKKNFCIQWRDTICLPNSCLNDGSNQDRLCEASSSMFFSFFCSGIRPAQEKRDYSATKAQPMHSKITKDFFAAERRRRRKRKKNKRIAQTHSRGWSAYKERERVIT
jgi:hypothetical protein